MSAPDPAANGNGTAAPSTFERYRAGELPADIALMVKLVTTVRGFRARLDERLRQVGQSVSRMETLGAIMNMPGPCSQSAIARRLRVEGATVTRMVDVLSREGLVERLPDPTDRRVNLLSITPAGEEMLRQIFAIYDDMRDELLGDLATADRAELHRLLDLLLARVDKLETGLPDKAC